MPAQPHVVSHACPRCHGTGQRPLSRSLARTVRVLPDPKSGSWFAASRVRQALRWAGLDQSATLSAILMRLYKLEAMGLARRTPAGTADVGEGSTEQWVWQATN